MNDRMKRMKMRVAILPPSKSIRTIYYILFLVSQHFSTFFELWYTILQKVSTWKLFVTVKCKVLFKLLKSIIKFVFLAANQILRMIKRNLRKKKMTKITMLIMQKWQYYIHQKQMLCCLRREIKEFLSVCSLYIFYAL